MSRPAAAGAPVRQVLVLEGYPSVEQATLLGPNSGTRRWGVAKERAVVHAHVAVVARQQGIQPVLPPVLMTLTFVVPNRTRRDWDNYALIGKPVVDGLVKVGALVDDSFEYLTAAVRFRVERGRRALIVTLEKVG